VRRVDTPYIRAKAKDNVDALDNLTAYLDQNTKDEVVQYVTSAFDDIRQVIDHAIETGSDPASAYAAYVTKFREYWTAPSD
jgi:hypothetical protein